MRSTKRATKRALAALFTLSLLSLAWLGSSAPVAFAQKGQKTFAKPKFTSDVESIFFDDAFQKLGPGTLPGELQPIPFVKRGSPASTGTSGTKVVGTPSTTPMPMPTVTAPVGPASTAEAEWATLIAGEAIESEIKALNTATQLHVKAKGTFSANGYKKARVNFSVGSVMFGIIAQYSGEVRWKEQAPAMRDVLGNAAAACKDSNDSAFKKAKEDSEMLNELVRGSKIDLPKAAETPPAWPDLAELHDVMMRMESGFNLKLKDMTSSKDMFSASKDEILHEAQILAALGQVIQDSGYNEEADYKQFAAQIRAQALELATAVRQDAFENATQAMGVLGQTCDACHAKHK